MKGELAVKSDFIMKSYDKRPDATSEAITKEGWLLTGEFILLMSELYYTAGMKETTVIWCENIDFVLLNRKKNKWCSSVLTCIYSDWANVFVTSMESAWYNFALLIIQFLLTPWTGDYGYMDKEGKFYICERLKQMIKCLDNQLSPAELEDLLLQVAYISLLLFCNIGNF